MSGAMEQFTIPGTSGVMESVLTPVCTHQGNTNGVREAKSAYSVLAFVTDLTPVALITAVKISTVH